VVQIDQSAIDRGEAPARTLRQLSSAIRQNLAGAGADLYTINYLLDEGRTDGLREAALRLRGHLERAEAKLKLAIEEEA
jgi:hypothetical protein